MTYAECLNCSPIQIVSYHKLKKVDAMDRNTFVFLRKHELTHKNIRTGNSQTTYFITTFLQKHSGQGQ